MFLSLDLSDDVHLPVEVSFCISLVSTGTSTVRRGVHLQLALHNGMNIALRIYAKNRYSILG